MAPGNNPTLTSGSNSKPLLRKIEIRNYKSVGACSVQLGRLTVVVGRNGAGKSNFLDALRFVADGLQTSLDHAILSRGGIDSVRRRSTGHPRNVWISLDLQLPERNTAKYHFEITTRTKGAIIVKQERLEISNEAGDTLARYVVEDGIVGKGIPASLPVASSDRLYLVAASSLPEFRPVYNALSTMGFYSLNPAAMKELQSPNAVELLRRDGSNIASVLGRLSNDQPSAVKRVEEYLEKIVPDIKDFSRITLGPKETLEFRQDVKGAKHPWKFYASNMSDGTLRALGAITAVMQLAGHRKPLTLVGIEEPETALHPAAAGALMDALREAASNTQVLLTSHSPDLVDQIDSETDMLLVVESHSGTTIVAPPDVASKEAIRKHLYSPGQLLKMDQLEADKTAVDNQRDQLILPFESTSDMEP